MTHVGFADPQRESNECNVGPAGFGKFSDTLRKTLHGPKNIRTGQEQGRATDIVKARTEAL